MKRRDFLISTGAVAMAAALPHMAAAQDIDRLQLFVPANPGGGWDQTARVMDAVMRQEGLIGSSIITNAGGAGGTVGLPQFIGQYDGDGAALMTGGMVMIGAIITNNSPVDLTMTTPIARLTGEYITIVVPAASDIQNLGDLVEKLKADVGSVSWAGGGAGGSDHILAGLLAQEVGVDPVALSWVAFAGGGEALAALLGNQVTCGVSGWGEFAEQVSAGALRAIAISAPERVPGIDVPTIIEQGHDVELLNWRGVFGAPNITDEDRAALIELVTTLDASEAWQTALSERSWDRLFLAGDDFEVYLAEDINRIKETLASLGLAAG